MADLTQVRLVDDDGTGEEILRLDDSLGLIVTNADIGFPEVRSISNNRPTQDGTIDGSRYIGSRTVNIEVLMPSVGWYLVEDQLRAVLHPQNRYYLYLLRDGWTAERRMLVRGAGYSPPTREPRLAQLQWVATEGFMEEDIDEVGLVPTFTNNEGGNATPYVTPLILSAGFAPGVTVAQVDGTVPVSPTATIYGPCTNPTLTIGGTTTQVLAFNTTIPDGHFLYVDFTARTALLDNDPTLSLYGALDFTQSVWWTMPPGEQSVAFRPATAGTGSQTVLSWRPRYI